jgi:Tetracyclin repressor-like, C-terminal domain
MPIGMYEQNRGENPNTDPPRKRGPKDVRGVVVDRIVEVARGSFAEQRYDGTSMRSVAIAAGWILTSSAITSDPGAVATNLDDWERLLRGGLVANQMLRLAMTRYVWKLEPIASLPDEEVVTCIAPTVQRYLRGELRPQHSERG